MTHDDTEATPIPADPCAGIRAERDALLVALRDLRVAVSEFLLARNSDELPLELENLTSSCRFADETIAKAQGGGA